jgi:hypothetical protein
LGFNLRARIACNGAACAIKGELGFSFGGADLLAFKEFDGGYGGVLLTNIAFGLHKVIQVMVGFK